MDKVLKAVQLLTLILVSLDAKILLKSGSLAIQECMDRIKP